MKKITNLITVLIITVLINNIFGQEKIFYWNGTTEELDTLISSNKDNQVVFALQTIITNANSIRMNGLAYDIYQIFRNHENDKIRQLALAALYKTQHYFVLKNLEDDFYREENPEIRRQIAFILDKMPVLSELN